MAVSLELRGLDRMVRDLQKYAAKAFPFAARETVNGLAFESRKTWIGEIERNMVLRNRWTVGSIRVEKARGMKVESMQAVLGSLAKYMLAQEEGAPTQLGNRTAIPTGAAAGQPGARPRTRLVRPSNRLAAIKLSERGTGSRHQRNAIAINRARAAKNRFVYLETTKGKGLFRLMGNERRGSVVKVWAFQRSSPAVPANPTLEPTVKKALDIGPRIAIHAMLKQLSRAKVLGY